MGPIERDLRKVTGLPEGEWSTELCRFATLPVYSVARSVCDSFGLVGVFDAECNRMLPDVLSEAIEAAEALNL